VLLLQTGQCPIVYLYTLPCVQKLPCETLKLCTLCCLFDNSQRNCHLTLYIYYIYTASVCTYAAAWAHCMTPRIHRQPKSSLRMYLQNHICRNVQLPFTSQQSPMVHVMPPILCTCTSYVRIVVHISHVHVFIYSYRLSWSYISTYSCAIASSYHLCRDLCIHIIRYSCCTLYKRIGTLPLHYLAKPWAFSSQFAWLYTVRNRSGYVEHTSVVALVTYAN